MGRGRSGEYGRWVEGRAPGWEVEGLDLGEEDLVRWEGEKGSDDLGGDQGCGGGSVWRSPWWGEEKDSL